MTRDERLDVHVGKGVRGSDGAFVGRLVQTATGHVAEWGWFAARRVAIVFDEVFRTTDDDLFLRRPASWYRRRALLDLAAPPPGLGPSTDGAGSLGRAVTPR